MSDLVLQKNLGALIDVKALSLPYSWTAGSGSDDVTFTGLSINRAAFGSLPRSADIDVYYAAHLSSGATLSLALDLQTAPQDVSGSYTDYATSASAVVATGPSGGGQVEGIARLTLVSGDNPAGTPGVDLGSAQQFLRLLVTPDLSATGTDTATIVAVGVFGGFDALAAPTN